MDKNEAEASEESAGEDDNMSMSSVASLPQDDGPVRVVITTPGSVPQDVAAQQTQACMEDQRIVWAQSGVAAAVSYTNESPSSVEMVAEADAARKNDALTTECDRLREQVNALEAELDALRPAAEQVAQLSADLAAQRRKREDLTMILELSNAHVQALQSELSAAHTTITKAEVDVKTLKEEVAMGVKKQQLLSRRLVEISTRIEVPMAQSQIADIPEVDISKEKVENAATQLQETRSKVISLKTRWAAMRKEAADAAIIKAEFEEAKRRMSMMEEQQEALQQEISMMRMGERKRRDSFSSMTTRLSEITTKLDSAETSWTPWKDINDVKQQLGNISTLVYREGDVPLAGHDDEAMHGG